MNSKTSLMKWFVLLCVFSFIISCSSLPKKEMDEAKTAIMNSKRVEGPKYAPKTHTEAVTYYSRAEKLVKEEEFEEARTNAVVAKRKGNEAYFYALNEFVQNQNSQTKKARSEAQNVHSQQLFPEKFQSAEEIYNQVQADLDRVKALSKEIKALEKKSKKK
ncbi:MAG: DUF4398 domain-containing protein [Spirochaetes bacterium]|nr:DUF4398 domain-containing protein [Spirochaetota bacterium]